MNKYIGIRVTAKKIFYTIFSGNEYYNDTIIVPQALSIPRQLSYIRTVLQSIITEQEINIAGLRLGEGNAKITKERIYIEGVIQEFFANSSIEKYSIFRLQSIARMNNVTLEMVKDMISGKELLKSVSDWSNFSKEHKESFLVAYAFENGGANI